MKKKTIFITVISVAVLVVAGKGLLSKRKAQMENDILAYRSETPCTCG